MIVKNNVSLDSHLILNIVLKNAKLKNLFNIKAETDSFFAYLPVQIINMNSMVKNIAQKSAHKIW